MHLTDSFRGSRLQKHFDFSCNVRPTDRFMISLTLYEGPRELGRSETARSLAGAREAHAHKSRVSHHLAAQGFSADCSVQITGANVRYPLSVSKSGLAENHPQQTSEQLPPRLSECLHSSDGEAPE
jgi:hypothetical protein